MLWLYTNLTAHRTPTSLRQAIVNLRAVMYLGIGKVRLRTHARTHAHTHTHTHTHTHSARECMRESYPAHQRKASSPHLMTTIPSPLTQDGHLNHLYRVGDMIPQFTCGGFHGCECIYYICIYIILYIYICRPL
jgi:hypothetical protein